ncbi:MAG: hypothetical protein CSA76_00785 [Spirochaetales bacterium]|nr:MAG: hypothetical protein CSA76_00785 [Spirochaetales bacterium]
MKHNSCIFFLLFFLLSSFPLISAPVSREELTEILSEAAQGNSKKLAALAQQEGAGSWYILSAAAGKAGYRQLENSLKILSVKKDGAPFSHRSLVELLKENPRALVRPLAALKRAEREGCSEDLRAVRISLLASRSKERALAKEFAGCSGQAFEAPVLSAALKQQPENEDVLRRAGEFISACPEPEALKLFDSLAVEHLPAAPGLLYEGRTAFVSGSYKRALDAFQKWMEAASKEADVQYGSSAAFEEAASAAEALGQEKIWADTLLNFAQNRAAAQDEKAAWACAFQAGILYEKLQLFEDAAAAYSRAAEVLPVSLERDKAGWRLLRVLPKTAALSAEKELAVWENVWRNADNPERFTDRLEEFLQRRVSRGEWRVLEESYRKYSDRWSLSGKSLGALALAFGVREGFVRGGQSAQEYLEEAAAGEPWHWAALRSRGFLGGEADFPPETVKAGPAETACREEQGTDERILELYLRWDMAEAAAEKIQKAPYLYSCRSIRSTARALAETQPRLSIRIAYLLWNRPDFKPCREDLLLCYPLPEKYREPARRAAEEEGVPVEILYGLIRVESAWDSNAVSRSGAEGLAQFMPATWEEWRRRLGYGNDADPLDGEVSLVLAAAYLDWLYSRNWTSGWIDTLAAYNAGGGRVRSWRRWRPYYGDDLFGMSLPVEESRYYVRKVLAAATLYGILYEGRGIEEMHREWELEF